MSDKTKELINEVLFLINCFDKNNSNELFKTRLKELYLEGEISEEAYKISQIIWFEKSEIKPVSKNINSFDPCSGRSIKPINRC